MKSSQNVRYHLTNHPGTLPPALLDTLLASASGGEAAVLAGRSDLSLAQSRTAWERTCEADPAGEGMDYAHATGSHVRRLNAGDLSVFLAEVINRWLRDPSEPNSGTGKRKLAGLLTALTITQTVTILAGNNPLAMSLILAHRDDLSAQEMLDAIRRVHQLLDTPDNGLDDLRDLNLCLANTEIAIRRLYETSPEHGIAAELAATLEMTVAERCYELSTRGDQYSTAEVEHLTRLSVLHFLDQNPTDDEWAIEVVRAHGHQMSESTLDALAARDTGNCNLRAAVAGARARGAVSPLFDPLTAVARTGSGFTVLLDALATTPDVDWARVLAVLGSVPNDIGAYDAASVVTGVLSAG